MYKRQVPDVKDFNAVDYVPGNTGPSALSIVDGPAQGTLPGGNAGGEGSGGAGSGGAVGPVVDLSLIHISRQEVRGPVLLRLITSIEVIFLDTYLFIM